MERALPIMLAAMSLSTAAQGQNLFVEAHGSWLLPLGGYPYDANYSSSTVSTGTTYTFSSVLSNYGKGIGGGLVFGGAFAPHLGWELRGTYVAGGTSTVEGNTSSPSGAGSITMERCGRYVKLEPALRVRTGDLHQWYAAFGPSMLVATVVKETTEAQGTLAAGGNSSREEAEFTGRTGWGAFGALGYAHQGSGPISFFLEVNATAVAWAPERYEITSLTVDGVDRTNSLTTHERVTEFVDEHSTTDPFDPDAPNKEPRTWLPMSTWGIRAGIRMPIGRQERHELELKEEQVPGR